MTGAAFAVVVAGSTAVVVVASWASAVAGAVGVGGIGEDRAKAAGRPSVTREAT